MFKNVRGLFLLLTFLLASCGTEPPCIQYTLPLCPDSWATDAELTDLKAVEQALLAVEGWIPCYCCWFVHDLAEAQAAGLPQSRKDNRTDGLVRGQCQRHRGVLVVRVYGDSEPYTMSLLVHEAGHGYWFEHGDAMWAFEQRVWEAIVGRAR